MTLWSVVFTFYDTIRQTFFITVEVLKLIKTVKCKTEVVNEMLVSFNDLMYLFSLTK